MSAFAIANASGKNIQFSSNPPIFYGGGTSPPPSIAQNATGKDYYMKKRDKRIKVNNIALSMSQYQGAFSVLSIIGIVLTVISLLYILTEQIFLKQQIYPLFFVCALHSGMLIVFISLPYLAMDPTVNICVQTRFLIPIGYGISYGAIFAKLYHLSRSLKNRKERLRGVSWTMILGINLPILVANIVLALVWYYSSPKVSPEISTKYHYIIVSCILAVLFICIKKIF
jgi:hypothetical protein